MNNDRISEIRARCDAATPIVLEVLDEIAQIMLRGRTRYELGAIIAADEIIHARAAIPYLLSKLAERDQEIEHLREAQRWITVEERLPENGEEVYATDCVETFDAAFLLNRFYDREGERYVTHWHKKPTMPPAALEEGE